MFVNEITTKMKEDQCLLVFGLWPISQDRTFKSFWGTLFNNTAVKWANKHLFLLNWWLQSFVQTKSAAEVRKSCNYCCAAIISNKNNNHPTNNLTLYRQWFFYSLQETRFFIKLTKKFKNVILRKFCKKHYCALIAWILKTGKTLFST